MPEPKIFLYKAAAANTVGILRRGTRRDEWELIQWDVDTTRGASMAYTQADEWRTRIHQSEW